MNPLAYFAALNRLEKLTPLRFARLLAYFEDDPAEIWHGGQSAWREAGIEQAAVSELFATKQDIDPEATFAELTKIGATVLPITSDSYPILLKEIYAPPPVLLVRGTFPAPADRHAIAVVGSRVTTPYGRQAATAFARDLAAAGVTIVSGLATGVDAIGHQAAVHAGTRTVAVLGCGIDQIYPYQNQQLAEDILAKGGAIISEYPIGTAPSAYNFPQRNRIIAGLSRGVLVVEGREKSGSLITAELALEYGREVFAVPGSIFAETSAGPNRLIRDGARPVQTAADILDTLQLGDITQQEQIQQIIPDSPEEGTLLAVLTREPQHADELTRRVDQPAASVGAVLSLLEMKGLVQNLGGNQWVRR